MLVVFGAGANYRTPNFSVDAATPELAQQVGSAAETWRRKLAIDWLGRELPAWPQRCHVAVRSAPHLPPGGRTRMLAEEGSATVWEMSLEGPLARILDSVLPHEMTHAVFATHFRRPLPRWADEGASTVVEAEAPRAEQQQRVTDILLSGTALTVAELLAADYEPENASAMYVQGYSLTTFFLDRGGKQKFVEFLDEGVNGAAWSEAVHRHYGFQSLGELQAQWLQWVMPGF
jgi:hypothetical protein